MSRFEGETKGVPRSALGLAAVGFRCRRLGGGARRGENATRRAAIDSDARRGYTYQYNRRGRNVTVGAKKKSGLPCDKPDTAHANCSLSVIKEHISQNHKKLKITLSPLVILLCCALSRSPRRGLSGVVQPSTSRPAVAPPCGRRTRPPCRDEENNTTFAPKSTPFRPKCTTFRHSPTRGRHDTRPRIRASVEVHFLPSPFIFTSTALIYKRLCVNITPVFCFTEVKAKGVKPSHLSPYRPTIYAQWVKR